MPKLNQKLRNRTQKGVLQKKNKKVKIFKEKEKANYDQLEIISLESACKDFDPTKAETFGDFPISKKMKKGLDKSGYVTPTPIQRESVGLSLKGNDILGAAKTGSGKTLAFLIPVLELLFKQRWSRVDGLGALIVTPTRELAYQIFAVLTKVGKHFDFSAGLIIGGTNLKSERKLMDKPNIIIGTPGRLLDHMDRNTRFNCSNLQILVLDEADRILDSGFQETMNRIIENLPIERQTLLFSATQTKSVKDLARLSLKDPLYVSVNEHSLHSTPEHLQQHYILCELCSKMDLLWSFIKLHKKHKILVFLSSCKQVRYTFEIVCRMRPGMSILSLHGGMNQIRRMAVYDAFCQKQTAVLFATDIAARGLDFPEVDWVVQVDCPEDATEYIHRAGRTARCGKNGECLLFLLPSEEEAMLEELSQRKIPINKIKVNPKKQQTIQPKMEAFLARDPMLKDAAQRSFVAYLKSVFLMRNKKIFDVQKLNTDAFARSLGLATVPRIRFLQKHQKGLAAAKKSSKKIEKPIVSKTDDGSSSSSEEEEEGPPTSVDDSDLRKPYTFAVDGDDDDLFTVKRLILPDPETETIAIDEHQSNKSRKKAVVTKAAVVKKLLKKNIKLNVSTRFDDEGNEVRKAVPHKQIGERARTAQFDDGGIDIDVAKSIMEEEDQYDKQIDRERIKLMHKKQKLKAKEDKRKRAMEGNIEEEEFGTSESEDETYNELIDALPDPDAVYGKEDDAESDDESDSFGFNDFRKNKRKLKSEINNKSVKRQRRDYETLDTGLTLGDEEELALRLLNAR